MPPVGKGQFDTDLAAEQAAVTDYITAVTAFIALQPVLDLAAEDATVQTALTAITTAKAAIPHA